MSKKVTYPAIVNKNIYEDQILYNITFPDISTANTYGISINDAISNGEMLLKVLIDGSDELPNCSTIEEIKRQFPDSVVSLVTVDLVDNEEKYVVK